MIRRTISILTGLAAAIAILVAVAVAVALPAHAAAIHYWGPYPRPLPSWWHCGGSHTEQGFSVQGCTRATQDAAGHQYIVATIVATSVSHPHAHVASTDGGLFYWNGNAVPGSSVFCAPTSFSVGGTASCSGSPVPVSTITHGGCTVVRAYVNVHLSDGQEISAPGADVSLRGNGAAAAAC